MTGPPGINGGIFRIWEECTNQTISSQELKEKRESASILLPQHAQHALLVLREHRVLREPLEPLVHLDYLDLLVHKDQKETKDFLAMMDNQEPQEHLAMMVCRDIKKG